MQDEYRFEYLNAKPNRFATKLPPGGRLVYLEPAVAAVFTDSESVNQLLRAVVETMTQGTTTKGASKGAAE